MEKYRIKELSSLRHSTVYRIQKSIRFFSLVIWIDLLNSVSKQKLDFYRSSLAIEHLEMLNSRTNV